MVIDCAPLEGITDSIYRKLHHAYFPGIHRYYMPFLSPTIHRTLTHKEDRELPLADSVPFTAVPQILTRDPEAFLWAAEQCALRGYSEVNLNIGCPSGTVVAKGKGAGMLSDTGALDKFLDRICSGSPLPVSVKTRVGVNDTDALPRLVEIYNAHPISELIVHPRTRKDFYTGPIRQDAFRYILNHYRGKLCYNGDITSPTQAEAVLSRCPGVNNLMVGRGLIADPGMFTPGGTEADTLHRFHDHLLEEYSIAFGSARNAIFRMKEHWHYLGPRFQGSEKLLKQLRKTTDLSQFRSITTQIFQTLPRNPLGTSK